MNVKYLFLCLCFLAGMLADVGGNPVDEDTQMAARITAAEKKVNEISGCLLRDAALEMVRTVATYGGAQNGSTNTEHIVKLCRNSQAVYCFFKGFEQDHSLSAIKCARAALHEVYEIVLEKLAWIPARGTSDDEAAKVYESIYDKHVKISLRASQIAQKKSVKRK